MLERYDTQRRVVVYAAVFTLVFNLAIAAYADTSSNRAALISQLLAKVLELNQKIVALGGTPIAVPPGLAALAQGSGGNAGGAATCTIERTLALGSRGEDVSCLQRFLISQNLLAPDSTTGYFGPLTRAAVIALQTSRGLEPVGHIGRLTREIVNAVSRVSTATQTASATQPSITSPAYGGVGSSGGGGGERNPPPVSLAIPAPPTAPMATSSQLSSLKSILPDPGLTNPRFHFHLGQVDPVTGQPAISPILPDIPGDASPWFVAQWNKDEYMRPDLMFKNSPYTTDPLFGNALYAFPTPSNYSQFGIYRDTQNARYVYRLYSRDGALTAGGGANVFLSADAIPGATLDHVIIEEFDAKFPLAQVSYTTPTATSTGAVVAQIFSGFGFLYTDPTTHAKRFFFMQIGHSDSRDDTTHWAGYIDSHLFGGSLPGDPLIPFASSAGPLQHYTYNVNAYLCAMLSKPVPKDHDGTQYVFPEAAKDFKNWRITGMYIGLETQNRDARPGSASTSTQGSVGVALELAGLNVMRHANTPFTYAQCLPAVEHPPVVSITASAATTTSDTVTGQPFTVTWSSTNADSCSVYHQRPDGLYVSNGMTSPTPIAWATSTSGSKVATPIFIGTHTYRIDCAGSGGSTHQDITHAVMLANAGTFFDDPTGFFIVDPSVDARGMPVAYGAMYPSANWSIAQWNIPGKLPPFSPRVEGILRVVSDVGQGISTHQAWSANGQVVVKQKNGITASFSLSQDGAGLACYPDEHSEYDLFAGPNSKEFAPAYPSAVVSDRNPRATTTLSAMTSLTMDADLMITNVWRDTTPACAVNQRGMDLSAIFTNYGDATHPSQTLFYDITPYLTRCTASSTPQECDAAAAQVRYFYFDGTGANAFRNASGTITHQDFGYADDIASSYGVPYMTPLKEQAYSLDILPRVKQVIASGPNGMDHDLSHWHLGGMYGGSHIWGNVGISSEWKRFNVRVR